MYPGPSPMYLIPAELNALLEHSPDNCLLAAWSGEGAQVAVVMPQFLLLGD